MAVLPMQRISIYGLKKERKQLLELLQRLGVIEINDVLPENDIFQKADVSVTEELLQKNIAAAGDALQLLDTYIPVKKSLLDKLKGRTEISAEQYEDFHKSYGSVTDTVNRIRHLAKIIVEARAELLKFNTQKELIKPWAGFDLPVDDRGTKHTKTFIGTLPGEWTMEGILMCFDKEIPAEVEIFSVSREQTCIFLMCLKRDAEVIFEKLREVGFTYPNLTAGQAPACQISDLEQQITEKQLLVKKAEEEIRSFKEQRENICFLLDYDSMRVQKYEVIGHLLQSKKLFILTGYIPGEESERLKEEISSKFEAVVEVEQLQEGEEPPVLLRNNGFSNPLEGIVESYSPPAKGEIDPTMVMSLFYYLLFGLMLSDAGYGAIIAVCCTIGLKKYKDTMEESMRRTLKMFLYCGISTVFWGILFGSYFGDLLDVITNTYFGQKVTIPPLWFFPVNEPMRMLTFSMLLGIIHLLTGLSMKFYMAFKQKDYKTLFYDVILWFILLISSLLVLLSMEMVTEILGISFILPSALGNMAAILAALSAVGIILTNGRESKNPFKRFLKGLYALYGITGYLSDVLSYSRLLALGLATGVICTVINQMAAMAGGGALGFIPFTLIILFGHTLNIGINALGAYVHTNRLQYVEFFGKFYGGGGRKFQPYHVKTKYYRFKEENKNG